MYISDRFLWLYKLPKLQISKCSDCKNTFFRFYIRNRRRICRKCYKKRHEVQAATHQRKDAKRFHKPASYLENFDPYSGTLDTVICPNCKKTLGSRAAIRYSIVGYSRANVAGTTTCPYCNRKISLHL